MQETTGIEYLLDYDGEEYTGEDGLTMRFEIKRCPVSPERPLGVKYSLTLHDEYGTRILGFDNAHAVKPSKKKPLAGNKFAYDHVHRTASDKGTSFEVATAEQLLQAFFAAVDRVRREWKKD